MKPKRNRPVLHTTVGVHTVNVLAQASKDLGLHNFGATLDYIVADWVALKRAALQAATPVEAEAVPA